MTYLQRFKGTLKTHGSGTPFRLTIGLSAGSFFCTSCAAKTQKKPQYASFIKRMEQNTQNLEQWHTSSPSSSIPPSPKKYEQD